MSAKPKPKPWERLYWRQWGLLKKVLMQRGFSAAEAEEERGILTFQILNRPGSHKDFSAAEFTRWNTVVSAQLPTADLDSAMFGEKTAAAQADKRSQLIYLARKALAQIPAADPYAQKVALRLNRNVDPGAWTELPESLLLDLVRALEKDARRKPLAK